MVTKTIWITIPHCLAEEPVIFTVSKDSGVIPAITYAKVGKESAEFVLKLQGSEEQVAHAVRLFEEKGTVSPVDNGDHLPKS